jgi:hypothetical protein
MQRYEMIRPDGIPPDLIPLLLSLQGLTNRSTPSVFLCHSESGGDVHWVKWYTRYDLTAEEVSLESLLSRHCHDAKGFILYDPAFPDSLNVAITLAGVRDCWVCPPDFVPRLSALGLECKQDLRGLWNDPIEAYRWLMEKALDHCDLSTLANFEQSGEASPKGEMDFLMARRGFCMGLSINQADYPDEAACWDEVQNRAPAHSMMLGWHTPRDSEATHVFFGSRHNIWVYCGGAWNMSFHQHLSAKAPFAQGHCQQASCDPKARYVTLCLSDGDSWHSMVDVQKKFWLHPRRGEVPLGWQIAPIFAKVGPALLEYYYQTKTNNDYLLCGPSGIAYNYLSGFEDWRGYLKHTAEAMKQADLKSIWAINRVVSHHPGGVIEHRLKEGPIQYTRAQMEEFNGIKDQKGADWVDPQMVERYLAGIPDALGHFQGWERIPGEGPRWLNGKVWSPTQALVRKDIDAVLHEFDESLTHQPLPAFLSGHINCYGADMETVIEIVHRLEAKGYTVVRPDVYLRLAEDAFQRGLRS